MASIGLDSRISRQMGKDAGMAYGELQSLEGITVLPHVSPGFKIVVLPGVH